MSGQFQSLVSTLAIAISKCQLYSPRHVAVQSAAERLAGILKDFPEGQLSLMIVDDELVMNNSLFRDGGLHGGRLIRKLQAKGLTRIDFLGGVQADELKKLIADIADAGGKLGEYRRIRAGVIDVRVGMPALGTDLDLSGFTEEQLERAKRIYGSTSPFQGLTIAGLDEIVADFLVTFRRGANILRMISPVRSHSEYTYTHAINVCLLSMCQAEHLGLDDETVHEIGAAALLHDIGKMFISKGVLYKEGELSSVEMRDMSRHPLLGAAYLVRMPELTRLAPVVALEHHLRYDGSGYPRLREAGRRQHVSSRIVAIADFFDALRSHRPYRRSVSVKEIIRMMQAGAGKLFDPALVENFGMILLKAL